MSSVNAPNEFDALPTELSVLTKNILNCSQIRKDFLADDAPLG